MNRTDADRWKSHVLDEIFEAIAESPDLQSALVFKGARVLRRLIETERMSLDLDSNLQAHFVEAIPDREAQRKYLEIAMQKAIRRHFEHQPTVRFKLQHLTIKHYPPEQHPQGWNAFKVRINVADLAKQIRALPALEIDIASPEELRHNSIAKLTIGNHSLNAYTLERIAGEKLRAFLSSLPAYRAKVKKPGKAIRAKDLYDLALIRRVHDLQDEAFWRSVGQEFLTACKSRLIDCSGLATFQEAWHVTAQTYNAAIIPKNIPFSEAESNLVEIVRFLVDEKVIPFSFPLPTPETDLK